MTYWHEEEQQMEAHTCPSHDEVVRLRERIDSLINLIRGAIILCVPLVAAYVVFEHRQIEQAHEGIATLGAKIAALDAHGSTFTQGRAERHHARDCHLPRNGGTQKND